MSIDFIAQEPVIRLVNGIISRVEGRIALGRKKKKLQQEMARILSLVQNEPFFDEINDLVQAGNLSDQLVQYCTNMSMDGQSIQTRAKAVADACDVSIQYKSSVQSTLYRIVYAFFNIINEPEAGDAKALQNTIFEVNAEGKERFSRIDGKLNQLLAKPVARTYKPQSPDTETNVNLPVDNLRIQNVYFTGRDNLFSDIHKSFNSSDLVARTQIIAGLSGSGKTQIALEYAYRFKDQYDYVWWVPAETETLIMKAYQEFAARMQLIKTAQQDGDSIIRTVLDWMSNHNRWLFIYDNLEAITAECPWWPRSNCGNIIITTQNSQFLIGDIHIVREFSDDDAYAFLNKRTGKKYDHAHAVQLSERLGYFPLALEQAAAYIRNASSFKEYLELINAYGLEILEETEGIYDYAKSVAATWNIAFQKITNEAARQLLYLCAYLAPENIEAALFYVNAELLPTCLRESMLTKIKKNRVWNELTKYSLLYRDAEKDSFSMHRLLQEVVRDKCSDNPQWVQHCLAILNEVYFFEYGNVATQNQFVKLTPHVDALLSTATLCLPDYNAQKAIAGMFAEGGRGFYYLGYYHQALDWYQKALAIREKGNGKEHLDTASTYHNIAMVYVCLGDYPKALELLLRALEISEKALGKVHPETTIEYSCIAVVYAHKGDYSKALGLFQKVFAIRERVLGNDHPDTATSYSNIAGMYDCQGDYQKALEWYQKALAICEKVLGKEHPDTAATYSNIAGVYHRLGNYPKALELLQKALAIHEKLLGKDHPDTATPYNNIAGVYDSLGNYSKAFEWYNKALVICEKVFGNAHPKTAITYNNIAQVYYVQGDYPVALEWHQKALVIRERVLGKDHPDTANSYHNIAGVYGSQDDYQKALEWYQKALVIREKVLSKEHPETAATNNGIAGVYGSQGDYQKALEWYQKALAIREKVLGKEHPETAATYNDIAGVYNSQGDYQKAFEWYQKALAIREKVLGKEHPDSAATYNNIARVYEREGDTPKALEWFQKALVVFEMKLGINHPYTHAVFESIRRLLQ